jgi:hypothetical protein
LSRNESVGIPSLIWDDLPINQRQEITMDQKKVLIDLDRAHRLIRKVRLQLVVSNLLAPKMPELEEELADSVALIVAAQAQMRNSRRYKRGI